MHHVVVGGASGIGAAVVEAERKRGTDVVVWDIAGEYDVKCDVTDPASVDAALEDTIARVGVPSEVTVTAGVGHSGMLLDLPVDEWDRIIAVNTRGPLLVMRAFARAMIDAGIAGFDRRHVERERAPRRPFDGRVLRVEGRAQHAGRGRGV